MTSPHKTTRSRAAISLTALLILGAGCSSSSDDASSTTSAAESESTTSSASASANATGAGAALTEADWRDQANAICADTSPQIGAAFGAMDPESPTDAQVAKVVSTLVSVNRDTEQRIGALTPPASLAAQAKALLDANEAATSQVEQQGPAALDSLDALFAPVNKMATDLGLTACAG